MGLRNVPVREVLGCWLERVVDGEGFIKVLTVRNLILSRRIHGSQKPGRGDVFGLDDAPTELWFWRFGIYKDAAPMGLRNVPVREVLGCWLERVVDGEGFIKVLTVRNLILSRRIHGSEKPGRGDVFGLDDAPTELWF